MTRHPRALYFLGLVQLWERFACFATLPLLVLYLDQRHGLRPEAAVLLLGLHQALCYLAGLGGGHLADRFLGHRLATCLGTVLLTLGYGSLALDRPALGPALLLLIAGHGLFKPALNALVGSLYSEADPRRDSGFLLLHVVFNVGAAIAPAVAEWARARSGWPAVFQVATLGMLASAVTFAAGAFSLRPLQRGAGSLAQDVPAGFGRERLRACWLVCTIGVVYWLTATQASTSLVLFAEQRTELGLRVLGRSLTVLPGHFMSLHAALVLVLAPPLGWFLSRLGRRGVKVSTPGKMAWGFVATGAAFAVMSLAGLRGSGGGRVSLGWLGGCYVLLTLGELLLSPIGLALVTRLAPPARLSRMVALWFAATAAGNALAGAAGFVWSRWPAHRYFALLALLSLAATAALLLRLAALERLLARSASAALKPQRDSELTLTTAGASMPSTASAQPHSRDAAPSRLPVILASLAILGPVPLIVVERLSLLVRGVSAVGCGLAILLGGPILVAAVIDGLGRMPCTRAS